VNNASTVLENSTLELNQVTLEAFVRIEEAKHSVGESIRLQHTGVENPESIRKLIINGKMALAQAWRLLKALDESYAG